MNDVLNVDSLLSKVRSRLDYLGEYPDTEKEEEVRDIIVDTLGELEAYGVLVSEDNPMKHTIRQYVFFKVVQICASDEKIQKQYGDWCNAKFNQIRMMQSVNS